MNSSFHKGNQHCRFPSTKNFQQTNISNPIFNNQFFVTVQFKADLERHKIVYKICICSVFYFPYIREDCFL